jgi:methylphosphotriester-DNA--protein-cysteine methyltransferase
VGKTELARALAESPQAKGLPPSLAGRVAHIHKQADETTVLVRTSLGMAVVMQDPLQRALRIERIRRALQAGGESAARAVIRSLVEQQAFFPRAFRRLLSEQARQPSPFSGSA